MNILMAEGNSGPSWLGYAPAAGEMQQTISAINQSTALAGGWVEGRNYCNGCTPEWDTKYRYLDQYIVDNNLYEGMGSITKSPVVVFLEEEVWPTMDQSFEGVIARNMGVPKEYVVSTLAFVNDMMKTPQDATALIASAPNIYGQVLAANQSRQHAVALGEARTPPLSARRSASPSLRVAAASFSAVACEWLQGIGFAASTGTDIRRRFSVEVA
jgi:hypothetical protein